MDDTATKAADIAHIIQLAVAPAFLLASVGTLLNVLTGRLSRVIDRARKLEVALLNTPEDKRDRIRWELGLLERRIPLANRAILLCSASGVLICAVVATLFVANLAALGFGRTVAVLFVLAMVLLSSGLATFLYEVHLGTRTIKIQTDLVRKADQAD